MTRCRRDREDRDGQHLPDPLVDEDVDVVDSGVRHEHDVSLLKIDRRVLAPLVDVCVKAPGPHLVGPTETPHEDRVAEVGRELQVTSGGADGLDKGDALAVDADRARRLDFADDEQAVVGVNLAVSRGGNARCELDVLTAAGAAIGLDDETRWCTLVAATAL